MSRSEDALRRLPMKMTASTRLVGGVTIVDLSGPDCTGRRERWTARSASQPGKGRD
jgi:hypothetical protein